MTSRCCHHLRWWTTWPLQNNPADRSSYTPTGRAVGVSAVNDLLGARVRSAACPGRLIAGIVWGSPTWA